MPMGRISETTFVYFFSLFECVRCRACSRGKTVSLDRQSSFLDFDWTLSLTHTGAYLSLDDILATSERTVCRLRVTLPGLAPLLLLDVDVSKNQEAGSIENEEQFRVDIPSGAKLEVPIWLGIALGSGRRQLLSVDVPLIYKDSFAEVFDADACVVDLRRKAPLYYLLLCNLLKLGSRVGNIVVTGSRVFQTRLKTVMDAALNASRQDTLFSTSRFDNLEMALFRVGQAERLQLEQWTERQSWKIEPTHFLRFFTEDPQHKRPRILAEINGSS